MAVKVEHHVVPKNFRPLVEKGTKVVSVTIDLGRDRFHDWTDRDAHVSAERVGHLAAVEKFIEIYGNIDWDMVDCSVAHTTVSVTYELRQAPE